MFDLKPGRYWFKSWKDVISFLIFPLLPRRIVYVHGENDSEHYYWFDEESSENEVFVRAGDKVSTVALIPRCERDGAAGPRTVSVLGGDIWKAASKYMPFDLKGIRGACIWWCVVWSLLIYVVYLAGIFWVLVPPTKEITIAGETFQVTPAGWSPDPLNLSIWLIILSYMFGYVIYNIWKFKERIVETLALVELPTSVSGVKICTVYPKPLSNLNFSDFMRVLGKRGPVEFINDTFRQMASVVASLIHENEALRKQALDTHDALKRVHQIEKMQQRFRFQEAMRGFLSRPLVTFIIFFGGVVLGLIVGYFVGCNYAVQVATAGG